MSREYFEFHCSGGCSGYTMVPIDPEIDADIIFICPKCKHAHYRRMKGGKITEIRHAIEHESSLVHQIEPTLAAWSKERRKTMFQAMKELLQAPGGSA